MKNIAQVVPTRLTAHVAHAPATGPCALVLFGATGDLAKRKLVPALYNLAVEEALPETFALVGFSRSATSGDVLRGLQREALEHFSRRQPVDEVVWDNLSPRISAVPGAVDDPAAYAALRAELERIDQENGVRCNRLFYCATPASVFPSILRQLAGVGLISKASQEVARDGARPWARVIVEKPFGRDLESARALNAQCLEVIDEEQIYRIDHYLGKETVQNILVFRFANTIFEPLWNRNHVDHVEITMAEEIDVEGRGSFYEETGVIRDIVQNHLLQMLALCAMEPPVSFEAEEIRDMKAQVLRSLRPLAGYDVEEKVVRGQYEGYRDEKGVAPGSCTPTYVALTAHIDNWRWQGVPFYLRAGKALARRVTEISFHFRQIPFCLFGEENVCKRIDANVLKLRIQPDEGISLRFASKVPGDGLDIGGVNMNFRYADAFDRPAPEAYERLLLDCMRGDATLFARRDEVELSWKYVQPILADWECGRHASVPLYARGSEGPKEATALVRATGHAWERLA